MMKRKLFMLTMLFAFMFSCSSNKVPEAGTDGNGYPDDPVYNALRIGTSKQDIIAALGKNYKFDMNNVTQTSDYYTETLIWESPSDPYIAYALTFVNNKLSRKTREPIVKDTNGGIIQVPR